MEAGFLNGKSAFKKGGLVAKIKNIEGKPLGKDGKPLKSILKSTKSNPYMVPPVGVPGVNVKDVGVVTNVSEDIGTSGGVKADVIKGDNSMPLNDTPRTELVRHNNDIQTSGVGLDARNQINQRKVQVSVLTNDEKVVGANVTIPLSAVNDISNKFDNTLYGYFIGDRLAIPIVEAYVKNAWAKYGFERTIFRNGFFFFKFSSKEGMVKTVDNGPWFVRSAPMFLNVWSAETKLKKEVITRVPVWVKIHNVPVVAFSEEGLSLIATQLGRPIMLDAGTSDMCLNPWGRKSFARILIELNSENAVLESIVVAIPLPKGKGHYLEALDVEYEWWPYRCSKCKIFGHEDDWCNVREKKVIVNAASGGGGTMDKKGKQVLNGGKKAAKTKQGFRFSRPKNNFMYRPVSKPATDKEDTTKHTKSDIEESVGAANASLVSSTVTLNGSSGLTNEFGFFNDEINMAQMRKSMDQLMDENPVIQLNTNVENMVNNNKAEPKFVKETKKESLLEQFLKSRDASSSKQAAISDSDESEVEEIPYYKSGGGFLDAVEDDLDCYDGYEAQIYDLTDQERAICDRYDIRLNSRGRK